METVEMGTGGGVMNTRLLGEFVNISDIYGWAGGDPPSKEFIESIRAHGLLQPVLVREVEGVDDDGDEAETLVIVDGRRRIQALLALGESQVPIVRDTYGNTADPRVLSLVANFDRDDNLIGNARDVWGLMDSGLTEQQIVEMASGKLKLSQVRALRDMRKLRPELIEAVEEGMMGGWAARMAARHDPDTVQEELVQKYLYGGRVTADDVKAARSIKQEEARSEISDLLFNAPDLDDESQDEEWPASVEDLEELMQQGLPPENLEPVEPKKPVKISRQDRLSNVRNLATQARSEIMAIKSSSRSDDENDILTFLDEILERLNNPVS